jgi:hypothetical protein
MRLPGRDKLERFIERSRRHYRRFMQGRYGYDELNRTLSALALAFFFACLITRWLPLSLFSLALVIICAFRSFSRNTGARVREANYYFSLKSRLIRFAFEIAAKVRQRMTYRVFTCPSCSRRCRVPKGKGRVRITCKSCGTQFIKKT